MNAAQRCPFPLLNVSHFSVELNRSLQYATASAAVANMFKEGAYTVLAYTFMALGLFGNGLCLLVLFRGASLQTPHFFFYKVMTAAELIYCATFFASSIASHVGMVQVRHMHHYKTVHGVHFVDGFARFIYSGAGFFAMYVSLIISVDRFMAIWMSTSYRRVTPQRKLYIGKVYSGVVFLLATAFHSWDAFFHYQIAPNEVFNKTFYRPIPRISPPGYITARGVKNVINFVVHVTYPIVLLGLTVGVMTGLMRHKAHRMSIVSSTSTSNRRRSSERRRERHLFYLMGAVVAMAFVQSIPVEIKRVLAAFARKWSWGACLVAAHEGLLPYSNASHILLMNSLLQWFFLIANVATMMDRSLKFYLYVILNDQFRTETVAVICRSAGVPESRRRESPNVPRRNSMSILSSFRTGHGSVRSRMQLAPEQHGSGHTYVAQRMSVA